MRVRLPWRAGRCATRCLWTGQLYSIYGALSLLSLFVWVNLALLLGMLPSLLKTLTGIETTASRSGMAWVTNGTFPLVVLALTVLCIEPLWKAVFVLRSFYAEALATGDDLRARLKSLRGLAAAFARPLLLAQPSVAHAAMSAAPPAPAAEPAQLDRDIDRVLQRREYAWRLPRHDIAGTKKPEKDPAWLASFFKWMGKSARKTPQLAPRPANLAGGRPGRRRVSAGRRRSFTCSWAYSRCCCSGRAGSRWRRRGGKAEVATAVEAAPDLQSDSVLASQLPEDGWLRLMREMLERGDLRLALRAAYLGCLAQLGERQLLSIARHKSNRDYWRELRRRARSREGLLAAFSENLQAFERVWYGSALVSREDLTHFAENLERMRAC